LLDLHLRTLPLCSSEKIVPDDFFETLFSLRRQKAWFLPPAESRNLRNEPSPMRLMQSADDVTPSLRGSRFPSIWSFGVSNQSKVASRRARCTGSRSISCTL